MNLPPERLGSFYLGAKYDLNMGKIVEEAISYDARDLTTHAICLGMTGSGKTGLCICLLEEAALDKVPAIIIDPKGDITNLLLQFPNLDPKDFEPWVNVDDARRKGMSVPDFSMNTAEVWRKGLVGWGITPERIALLKNSVEYTIFTPGSDSGVPVSILSSLSSPQLDFNVDGEAARDRVNGVVSALIGLLGLKVDPVRSPEGILLSNIFEYYWSRNEDLTIEKLVSSIQKPPFTKLGVFDLEAFYPSKDRFQLAVALNILIASPSFASWLRGETLDIDKLLYNAEGKPRHSIFYLAHLSDSERMFIVTLLLENITTWVRRQQGTTSLRAILYFDEVFGFMPPVAEPASKKPLMTLLKQARAFGLGITLVTQNPVDIDYKGLTNAGTWIIGKLQAERDKQKVIEGLRGAIVESGGVGGETDYNLLINKLSSRIFILHNIHQGPPQIIHSRWAMSYLRGPLTKPQITELMRGRQLPKTTGRVDATTVKVEGASDTPPSLDPKINQVFISESLEDLIGSQSFNQFNQPSKGELVYEPHLFARTTVGYYDKKFEVDHKISEVFILKPSEVGVNWDDVRRLAADKVKFSSYPRGAAVYRPISPQINSSEKIQGFNRPLVDYILQNSRLRILSNRDLNMTQRMGEDERVFAIRLRDVARELRDSEVNKIQDQYEEKLSKLESRIHILERDISSDKEEISARKREEYLGVGETVLGFFIGRRRSTGITTASRRRRMTEKAQNEVEEKQAKLSDLRRDSVDLEAELKDAVNKVTRRWDNALNEVLALEIKPTKGSVKVDFIALAWLPS